MEFENTMLMKKSENEYYNSEIDQEILDQICKSVARSARQYFHGVGADFDLDESGRVYKIHYTLPGRDAKKLFQALEDAGIRLGMICRNSWVDALEAKYDRADMGIYKTDEY